MSNIVASTGQKKGHKIHQTPITTYELSAQQRLIMSADAGTTPKKRGPDVVDANEGDSKRPHPDVTDETQFDGLFDPLPFDIKGEDSLDKLIDAPLENGDESFSFDLPGFLEADLDTGAIGDPEDLSNLDLKTPRATTPKPSIVTVKTEPVVPVMKQEPSYGLIRNDSGLPAASSYSPAIPRPTNGIGYSDTTPTATVGAKGKADDTSKLNDVIASAGVDIQREEELLAQQYANRNTNLTFAQQQAQRQRQYVAQMNAFLNPYHVASFMNKVGRDNGVVQNFVHDSELLELMSASCQQWLSALVTKTVLLSRHRRKGIPSLSKNAPPNSKKVPPNSTPRSEISKELRNLASKQKELEEKRVNKRILLGLEKSDASAEGNNSNRAGAEETLHRAANATAAMMAMNPGRKKYSWMTSSSGGADEAVGRGADKDGQGKQSSIISIRGDNGLRFREIRTGDAITMKDLLGVIEEERIGTEKAIIKGYAKLKD